MPTFIYKGITDKGLVVKNKVEEENKQKLMERLEENNITPIDIIRVGFVSTNKKTKRKNISNNKDILKTINTAQFTTTKTKAPNRTFERLSMYMQATKKITTRDIIIFTQDFYLLKKANFNNIHALNTIIESTENLSLRGVLQDILAGVESGEYMYSTMEYYSNIFPYIYTNMIKVGEMSGSLTKSLDQAIKYLEDSDTTSLRLKKIIIPNVLQLLAILALLIFGVAYIIPLIQDTFAEVGSNTQLPAITLWFVDFCNNLMKIWYIPVITIAAIVGIIVFYINTPKGKYNFHYFKYKMPIFGKLIYAIDFSRLMRAMLLNLENGMRIQDALDVSKSVVKNYVLLSIVETAINNILIGASWIEPFENSGLSSSMQTEMLKIGMQTDLTEMMRKLVEYMEIDIDNLIQKVMTVLPQVVYSIVGIFLIFLVLVIIVPCIQLYMGGWILDSVDLPTL